jgi:predicted nucleotidyltransferase
VNPAIGDPFRATAVRARRQEVARVVARGVARGDLREDADVDVATELLVGPVYFRLVFGGDLDDDFARRIAESAYRGIARPERAWPDGAEVPPASGRR